MALRFTTEKRSFHFACDNDRKIFSRATSIVLRYAVWFFTICFSNGVFEIFFLAMPTSTFPGQFYAQSKSGNIWMLCAAESYLYIFSVRATSSSSTLLASLPVWLWFPLLRKWSEIEAVNHYSINGSIFFISINVLSIFRLFGHVVGRFVVHSFDCVCVPLSGEYLARVCSIFRSRIFFCHCNMYSSDVVLEYRNPRKR